MPERRIGCLESFNSTPGKSHGYVRVDDTKFHVPTSSRGVLEGDTIRPCVNGERYEKIAKGTLIVIDLVVDAEGQNPFPVAWAPKVSHKT